MKKIFSFLVLLSSLQASTQLAVNILLPPGGLVQKQQLWNILITNPNTSPVTIRIQAVLTEVGTGQPVLSATTGLVLIPSGTKQLSAASIGPVQYNVMSSNYRIDPSPVGLLPVGDFNACYNFMADGGKTISQDCQPLNIQSLSPLLLNIPSNNSVLENAYPNFSWIPFSSARLFTNLTYSLRLVELYPGQSAADAMEKNIPVFTARNLSSNMLFYSHNSPLLQKQKQYAWQVTAENNLAEIIKSETWQFSLGGKSNGDMLKPDPVYVKLKKENEDGGYCLFYDNLRFEYFNETSDTTWNVQLTDISAVRPSKISLVMLDTIKMVRGENLVDISGSTITGLQHKHIYFLKLSNSRNEIWQLKFEYRKEEQKEN